MTVLILATSNRHKVDEIRSILSPELSGLRITLKTLNDFPPFPQIEETGSSYEENASLKAESVSSILRLPAIADDSGLEVDALDGKPGLYSSRFLGEETPYSNKNSRILDMMKNVPAERRGSRFVCAAALAAPGEKTRVVRGEVEGVISSKTIGKHGFGYDPIFFLPSFGKTMAELSAEEKNLISHRAVAFRKLLPQLQFLSKI